MSLVLTLVDCTSTDFNILSTQYIIYQECLPVNQTILFRLAYVLLSHILFQIIFHFHILFWRLHYFLFHFLLNKSTIILFHLWCGYINPFSQGPLDFQGYNHSPIIWRIKGGGLSVILFFTLLIASFLIDQVTKYTDLLVHLFIFSLILYSNGHKNRAFVLETASINDLNFEASLLFLHIPFSNILLLLLLLLLLDHHHLNLKLSPKNIRWSTIKSNIYILPRQTYMLGKNYNKCIFVFFAHLFQFQVNWLCMYGW